MVNFQQASACEPWHRSFLQRPFASVIFALFLVFTGCSKQPERLTIAFSNDTMGKIRSCGCRSNDLGGLGRRATFINAVRDTAQHLLVLDGGDFFGIQINYGKEKADISLKSMVLMKYDAVVPGEAEFSLGLEYLSDRVRETKLPAVLANVCDAQTGELLFPSHKIVTYASGLRVGLVGVLGKKITLPPQVTASAIEIKSPLLCVREVIEALRPNVDLIVVLAHMKFIEARDLAMNQEGIDIVVLGHEGRSMRTARQFNGAYFLHTPSEGKYMGIASALLGPGRKIERLTVEQQPMSSVFADDESVVKLFKAYDINIALKEKATVPTGVTHPSKNVRKPFVTAEKCKECHEEIFNSWKGTPHAAAFDTLVATSRNFDVDCTPCHSTGFYDIGGFVNAASTPDLVHVQCEACHGNGYDHSNDPGEKTRESPPAVCAGCHTEEWSPSFDFSTSWQKIAH